MVEDFIIKLVNNTLTTSPSKQMGKSSLHNKKSKLDNNFEDRESIINSELNLLKPNFCLCDKKLDSGQENFMIHFQMDS